MALKRYTAIQKLFNEFEDDQFDFHGYSLRKFNINIYMKCVLIYMKCVLTVLLMTPPTLTLYLAWWNGLTISAHILHMSAQQSRHPRSVF